MYFFINNDFNSWPKNWQKSFWTKFFILLKVNTKQMINLDSRVGTVGDPFGDFWQSLDVISVLFHAGIFFNQCANLCIHYRHIRRVMHQGHVGNRYLKDDILIYPGCFTVILPYNGPSKWRISLSVKYIFQIPVYKLEYHNSTFLCRGFNNGFNNGLFGRYIQVHCMEVRMYPGAQSLVHPWLGLIYL